MSEQTNDTNEQQVNNGGQGNEEQNIELNNQPGESYYNERAKIEADIDHHRAMADAAQAELTALEDKKNGIESKIHEIEKKRDSMRPQNRGKLFNRAWSNFWGGVQKSTLSEQREDYMAEFNNLQKEVAVKRDEVRDHNERIKGLTRNLMELDRAYQRQTTPGGGRGEAREGARESDRTLGRDPEGLLPANRGYIHPAAQGVFTEANRAFDREGLNPHPLAPDYRGPEDPAKSVREAYLALPPEERHPIFNKYLERERALPAEERDPLINKYFERIEQEERGKMGEWRDKFTEQQPESREPQENREQPDQREQREPQENREQSEVGKHWKDDLKQKIDQAREESRNMDEFRENLSQQGIQTNLRGNEIISFSHPGVQSNIRGTTLGEEYSREALERDFTERERDEPDIERETDRIGDEREPEREQYEYKADHPFARMCEAGARLREEPTPEHEREFFVQKDAWKEYADTRMEELKAERDGDSRASRETERDNSNRDDRDSQPELDRDQPEPDIDDRGGDDRGDDR